MKKIIALVLCGMMMVGALCAFAEDGIMPLYDCEHEETTERLISTERDGCITIRTYRVTCGRCPYSDTFEDVTENHSWSSEIIDGESTTVCSECGETK